MNPFTTPDRLFISTSPQDMRAGIQRLATEVAATFGMEPTDGALYCFVSRDCAKMKLLRYEGNGWCMYYCRLAQGVFTWRHGREDRPVLSVERRRLLWLLEGLDMSDDVVQSFAAHNVI